jgi:signal transduction histidine kinase
MEGRRDGFALGDWLFHHSPDGVALARGGKVVMCNRRYHALCSALPRWVCASHQELNDGRGLTEQLGAIAARAEAAAVPRGESYLFHGAAAEPRCLEATPYTVERRSGGLQAVLVLRDVTSMHELHRERAEAHRREQLLGMLAHELRNPLAPIVNAAELIIRHVQDPQAREAAEVILRQCRHQARLVEDLLEAARVRGGKVELKLETVDLREAVGQAVEMTTVNRGDRLTLSVALPEEPVWVSADRTRLVQVVVNLLVNAAKFTPRGGENRVNVETGVGITWVRVADTGIGIPADELPRIWDVFAQGEQPIDRAQGGLGLGLTLVKSLTELHGGGVRAVSAGPDQGAEFIVWLPTTQAPPEVSASTRETEPDHASRRVLVVEDNQDTLETLCELLTLEGHEVFSADNGVQGLEVARTMRPEVVVSDLGLPGMDGFALAEAVRAELPECTLIALSGYCGPKERERARTVGFNAYLLKPVEVEQLMETLQTLPVAA